MSREEAIQWLILAGDVLRGMAHAAKAYEADRAAELCASGARASAVAAYADLVLPKERAHRWRVRLVLAGRVGARPLVFIAAVLRATADCVELTRYERRTLARSAGRGGRAKRIPASLPRKTVDVFRRATSFFFDVATTGGS